MPIDYTPKLKEYLEDRFQVKIQHTKPNTLKTPSNIVVYVKWQKKERSFGQGRRSYNKNIVNANYLVIIVGKTPETAFIIPVVEVNKIFKEELANPNYGSHGGRWRFRVDEENNLSLKGSSYSLSPYLRKWDQIEDFKQIDTPSSSLRLKALEAYTRDVCHGIARIDYDSMDSLGEGASTGDIYLRGKRRTVAKCLPLYPSDEGKGITRIDGLIRNNAGVAIGDTLVVRKIKAVPAEKVIVVPLMAIPPIDEQYLTDALESVPLIKGDNVMVLVL
jgi:cell division protein 48 (CDC48)-like